MPGMSETKKAQNEMKLTSIEIKTKTNKTDHELKLKKENACCVIIQ